MNSTDISKFANSTKWQVVHDPDTGLYCIANERGQRKPSFYTHRRIAEVELYNYLEKVQTLVDKQMAKRKEK
jgi:hypothetical protein